MRKGNQTLRSTLVQTAWSAVRSKDTFLKACYNHLVVRYGKKKAIVVVAHSLLRSIWYMLAYHVLYQDLGGGYFNKRRTEANINYCRRQLQKLGCTIQCAPQPATG